MTKETPLSFVSAQDIYDTATDLRMYERFTDEETDIIEVNNSVYFPDEAVALLEIHVPSHLKSDNENDIANLSAMIEATTKANIPNLMEFLEGTRYEDE